MIVCALSRSSGVARRISTARCTRDSHLETRDLLKLLGHRQDATARLARERLGFLGLRELEEQLCPDLVVVLLVRLDRLFVEACGGLVVLGSAEPDELGVTYECERFPRKLSRGDAGDRSFEIHEIPEERASARRHRIEAR